MRSLYYQGIRKRNPPLRYAGIIIFLWKDLQISEIEISAGVLFFRTLSLKKSKDLL